MLRDNVVQYHFVYPNDDIISSYAARMLPSASVPDPPLQLLGHVVRPGNAPRKLTVRNNIMQYYFINPNSNITSSYAARMMSLGSALDPPLPFLERVVRLCNALFSGRGVPIVDRIYPVIPDPRRKPDGIQQS